jgi:DNA replication ATP-dependent helicase Dna2
VDHSLSQRLLRMLWREEEGEARSQSDLRALPAEERALEGECIDGALFRGSAGVDAYEFDAAENMSKFRSGDSVCVGDGVDFDAAVSMAFARYDAERHVLVLRRDPWARGQKFEFEKGQRYSVDRRALGLRGRLQEVVREGFADELVKSVLEGDHEVKRDEARFERAMQKLADRGLNDVQTKAAAVAIATESLAMIQGPPGTGKTRLLAEILRALCEAGCRIAMSAYTHRAVDNVLLALRKIDAEVPLFKLGAKHTDELRRAGVKSASPRKGALPTMGCVIAGTCFALAKLGSDQSFHFAVFDEAGQMPIPHAMAGMLLARRWVFVGDHAQLPPVITSHHADRDVTISVFEHLHRHYGSEMLDVSYRMSGPVCDVVGRAFYDGALRSAVPDRRLSFRAGGVLDEVIDPEKAVVIARVDHLQPGMRSAEESNLVADLVYDLRHRHEIDASEIAVLAPFRAQVRMIRSALQRKNVSDQDSIVVDTVERMQGQEREVVVISLAVGDPDSLSGRSAFFFSTNRLNVAMSRARSKVILVASRGAFQGLPMDPDSLRAASLFKVLFQTLPQVDLTKVYS